MDAPLRFHWMLPKGGEVQPVGNQSPVEAARYRVEATAPDSPAPIPDIPGYTRFVQAAEAAGLDSILISFSRYEPDPLVTAGFLGTVTQTLKYILAFRTGLSQPAALVQQTNTLSGFMDGRVSLNVVAGSSKTDQKSYGDFFSHDQRYERAREFMHICNRLWENKELLNFEGSYYKIEGGKIFTPFLSPDRSVPERYVSGHSQQAIDLAINEGDCWLRVVDTPEKISTMIQPVLATGTEVCLRAQIICRPTREEAHLVVDEIMEFIYERGKVEHRPDRSDSQMYREASQSKDLWIHDHIWGGFAPHFGPVWTTLVGTPGELAQLFMQYKAAGVSQFILSGWPEVDEVEIFGKEVLPLIRAAEQLAESSAMHGG